MHARSKPMGETTDSAEISDPVQRSTETTRQEGRIDTTTHPIVNLRYLVAVNTTQSIHIIYAVPPYRRFYLVQRTLMEYRPF